MLTPVLALALLVQSSPPSPADTVRPGIPADAYADSATARLVASVRGARERNERLVTAYRATVKQRIGVGIRALRRDRMLYRQELVARIDWKRDAPSRIEFLGAREAVPVAFREHRIPELDEQARSLVIDPGTDYLVLIGEDEDDGFVYPLREGGEADYRFAAGDTTTITLPTGRRIRLVSLRVTPRRSDWNLIAGTLWYDADSYGLVQAVFRPARPFEFKRDADEEDRKDVPGWVNPVAEVKYVTLEYGLYESRWWLPRYVAIEAAGSMGSWLGVPMRIERVYEDYEVQGGTPPDPASTFRPAGTVRQRRRAERIEDPVERARVADSIRAAVEECVARVDQELEDASRRDRRWARRKCRRSPADTNLVVQVPDDTTALLTSPALGDPILAMGDLISDEELGGLREAIGKLPSRPWAARVELPSGVGALFRRARYNRVEGLSLGLDGTLDLGPMAVRAEGRFGLADLEPNGELSLVVPGSSTRLALTGYRRLAAANPDTRPFGPLNSMLALLAQRDDGEYFRTLGVEATLRNQNSGWWSARAWWQRERPAEVETDASLPNLFDGGSRFRPNIVADSAEQLGAALGLRGTKALSRSLTLGGELALDGATGDYDLARGAATLRLFVTPGGPLAGALTASAGTSVGDVPVQSRFFLGGPATLRGYAGGALSGSAYWAGRAEIANSFPGARLALFTDVGWAGPRDDFWRGTPLVGAGIGASFLDGLLRVDLARALRAPTGWRLELYVDGLL